jgi:hypothetical protein
VAGPNSPALRTTVRILDRAALPRVLPGVAMPASPCMAGMVIRTDDGNAAARRVLAGLDCQAVRGTWGEGLLVPPEAAGGAAVVFAA